MRTLKECETQLKKHKIVSICGWHVYKERKSGYYVAKHPQTRDVKAIEKEFSKIRDFALRNLT
jgi:hypothetical protein